MVQKCITGFFYQTWTDFAQDHASLTSPKHGSAPSPFLILWTTPVPSGNKTTSGELQSFPPLTRSQCLLPFCALKQMFHDRNFMYNIHLFNVLGRANLSPLYYRHLTFSFNFFYSPFHLSKWEKSNLHQFFTMLNMVAFSYLLSIFLLCLFLLYWKFVPSTLSLVRILIPSCRWVFVGHTLLMLQESLTFNKPDF